MRKAQPMTKFVCGRARLLPHTVDFSINGNPLLSNGYYRYGRSVNQASASGSRGL
jgi:hypothetical protein